MSSDIRNAVTDVNKKLLKKKNDVTAEKLWKPHPWKCSRLGWMGLGDLVLMEGEPA